MASSLEAKIAIEKYKDDESLRNVGVDVFHRC
jgi:hypothetical protein